MASKIPGYAKGSYVAPESKEVMQSITELLNPKTGESFTSQDAQRILRAAMQRRAKAAKRVQQWRASKREMA